MKSTEKKNEKHVLAVQFLGTSFEDYAINNKNLNDNKNFIDKKQATSKFSFAFIYNGETFGVWVDYSLGLVFVSSDYMKNNPFLFACTLADHSPNTLLLTSIRKYNCWKVFIESYKLGSLRFENMKIKNITTELIKKIITKQLFVKHFFLPL